MSDQPQTPTGHLVAAIERGPDTDLRITLEEYEGHPYISLRVWEFDRSGKAWHPTRRGVSVRVGEARAVSNAILESLNLYINDNRGHDH